MDYQKTVAPGPMQGTPPPPTTPTPGADQGGRPSTSGGPDLGATMAKWRSGIFTPPPPGANMPGSAPSPAAGSGGAASGPLPVSPQTRAAVQSPPGAQPGAPAAPGQPGGAVHGSEVLPHVPQPHEVASLPVGVYETPIGTLSKSADGTSRYTLNEQGQVLYRQRYADSVKAFGNHPFANDLNAPPPPITPGGISYNPFSNTFSNGTPPAPGVA